jgi:hypothetical protein
MPKSNPAAFKAEHSEAEPRLVFLKPITTEASESNAVITTRQGEEISLHLISAGKATADARALAGKQADGDFGNAHIHCRGGRFGLAA